MLWKPSHKGLWSDGVELRVSFHHMWTVGGVATMDRIRMRQDNGRERAERMQGNDGGDTWEEVLQLDQRAA